LRRNEGKEFTVDIDATAKPQFEMLMLGIVVIFKLSANVARGR